MSVLETLEANGKESHVRVTGIFPAEGGEGIRPFDIFAHPRMQTINLYVLSPVFRVISSLLVYEVVGTYAGGVLYPSSVFMKKAEWDDRLSYLAHGCSLALARDLEPSKRKKSLLRESWLALDARLASFAVTGTWAPSPSPSLTRTQNAKLDLVRERSVRRASAVAEWNDDDDDDPSDWEALLKAGEIVAYRGGGFMLRDVYAALDTCDSALCDPDIEWLEAFAGDVPAATVEGGERLGPSELAALLARPGPGKKTVSGLWRFSTSPTIRFGRDTDLPLPRKIAHAFPLPQAWNGGEGIGSGGRKIWTAGWDFLKGDEDEARPLALSPGVRMLVVTSDPCGLPRAQRLASSAIVFGTPGYVRFAGERPSVGCFYAPRGGGRPRRITAVDAVLSTVTLEGLPFFELSDFWDKYVPFAACFSWDGYPPCDVVVLLATHELSATAILTAYDRALKALVVVGNFAPQTLADVMKAAW
jgi:hypothetical protein